MINTNIKPTDIDVIFADYLWPEKKNRFTNSRQILEKKIGNLNQYLSNVGFSCMIKEYSSNDVLEIKDINDEDDIIVVSIPINGKSFGLILDEIVHKIDKLLRQHKKYSFVRLELKYEQQLKKLKKIIKYYIAKRS